MKRCMTMLVALLGMSLLFVFSVPAATCPQDSKLVGRTCVDTYEASVWHIPDTEKNLIKKVLKGIATEANLIAGGATHVGTNSDDYEAAGTCPDTGNGCTDFYAVSIPGVTPSRFITWFQALAACRNTEKELLPNHVWQAAALGTPDMGGADDGSTSCNTDNQEPGVADTGSRSACVSDVGVHDMVGNLSEWVADWVPLSTGALADWDPPLNDDFMTMVGTLTPNPGGPGALIRGGNWGNYADAGVFAVSGANKPHTGSSANGLGFRCGR